jgi:hypothetical protein
VYQTEAPNGVARGAAHVVLTVGVGVARVKRLP